MSKGFIIGNIIQEVKIENKNFAFINVTYPEGSTCTCSNGTKTLTDINTDGKVTFSVPSTGTWTVSCTDGTNTNSKSVEITTEGQFEKIALSYELVLFDAGVDNTKITGGWEADGHNGVGTSYTTDGGQLTISNTMTLAAQGGSTKYVKAWYLMTVNKIDLSKYSALKATITGVTGTNVSMCVVNSKSMNQVTGSWAGTGDPVASVEISKSGEVGLSFGELNSSYYVGFFMFSKGTRQSVTVSKIWLE
jgi:hypothetical protein